MGSLVAFHTALELEKESPGLIRGVVFSGFASVPGPSSASPFGLRCLFCLTQVSQSVLLPHGSAPRISRPLGSHPVMYP